MLKDSHQCKKGGRGSSLAARRDSIGSYRFLFGPLRAGEPASLLERMYLQAGLHVLVRLVKLDLYLLSQTETSREAAGANEKKEAWPRRHFRSQNRDAKRTRSPD